MTATRTNDEWRVRPGLLFTDLGHPEPIDCKDLPAQMMPENVKASVAAAKKASNESSEPEAPQETAEQPSPKPASVDGWFLLSDAACSPGDPASIIALGSLVGTPVRARDVKENGKVVATTITADDGSVAKFYRGKARCQAALKREVGDLNRYR